MKLYKIKNKNIICFLKDELSKLFEVAKKVELLQEIRKQNFSFDDLKTDYSKMKKIADTVGERGAQHRDEHEIFASLFVFLDFYEANSEVCFELKNGFNPSKNKINTLKDLNAFRESASDSDFIIKSGDGLRKFQLKRYRNNLNTQGIFDFIKEKVAHYGNNLDDTNLLVVLQSSAYTISQINFHELHDKLKSLNLKFQGQILISYNENNKEMVINQVHPNLTTTRIPVQYPSTKSKLNTKEFAAKLGRTEQSAKGGLEKLEIVLFASASRLRTVSVGQARRGGRKRGSVFALARPTNFGRNLFEFFRTHTAVSIFYRGPRWSENYQTVIL